MTRRHAAAPARAALLRILAFLTLASAGVVSAVLLSAALASATLAAGPPFPQPVPGQRVYDEAGAFDAPTIESASRTIAAIESRTAAQVVVYSQKVDAGVTTEEASAQAAALMDQWGVGRRGFDDGLVILYDLDPSGCHGQVQLYAGAGFRSTFLSDAERQRIFDGTMMPLLGECRLGESLLAALAAVDASATPEHAATLERARQLDAVLGLIVAPLLLLLLIGWALWSWLRHGRDPVYLDDPSIHIPAPPPDLTPATGSLVYEGRTPGRAFTAALVDLGGRGELTFENDGGAPAGKQVSIDLQETPPADEREAWSRTKARRLPVGPAEAALLAALRAKWGGRVEADEMPSLVPVRGTFTSDLERHAVEKGWFARPPASVAARWYGLGVTEIVLGGIAVIAGIAVPFAGLALVGGAGVIGGIVTTILGYSMPARTLPGAMIRAMLAAYRRTLEKTMAAARSMDQVVAEAALPWLDSPDQAVVWGVALGLERNVEQVIARSLEDVRSARVDAASVYLPAWYLASSSGARGFAGWGGGSGGGGSAFSSSAVPSFSGMFAALGTIGSPASSSGGGGFGGGGSGGGGGAGGGF